MLAHTHTHTYTAVRTGLCAIVLIKRNALYWRVGAVYICGTIQEARE